MSNRCTHDIVVVLVVVFLVVVVLVVERQQHTYIHTYIYIIYVHAYINTCIPITSENTILPSLSPSLPYAILRSPTSLTDVGGQKTPLPKKCEDNIQASSTTIIK